MAHRQTQKSKDKAAIRALLIVIAVSVVVIVTLAIVRKNVHDSVVAQTPATDVLESTTHKPETKVPETTAPDTTTPVTTAPVTTAPVTTVPDTTVPVTTAPVTLPPDTTPPDTTPVQYQPPQYNSADWQATLAKYPGTVLAQTGDAGQAYLDKIVFLGDSTTYGLRSYGLLKGGSNTTQVWVPSSGTLTLSSVSYITVYYADTGEEITIAEAARRKKPEYVVITLGVNGVSFMSEASFKAEYSKAIEIIQQNSPSTKIICNSIYPVCASYDMLGSINNEKIDNANRWILETAAQHGVKFLDSNSMLRGPDGWMPESYHNGDGLHLLPNTLQKVLNNIRVHAWN